ncbi:hypothetical protein BRADO2946 [Bradyrhizobium sp. ORS 278]|uniref:hypothetical protein n=1 Tax=Bradyrhizobium sp. (strain ORS 278) TaxID=114615 RepID=UPI0001508F2B|nr:hypothetical protein [Bradyrhizobium sp. ORS 278]CAL76753.1 hypothetical protein BRADO2946 [Bradyrhizobium sp. ORS 278]
MARGEPGRVRKLIAFDEETFDKLKQLSRDQMLSLQDLADEAFMDLLEKHGVPADLKDALRRSAVADGDAVAATPVRKSKTKPRMKPRQRGRTAA